VEEAERDVEEAERKCKKVMHRLQQARGTLELLLRVILDVSCAENESARSLPGI
jgi:hypothetical protein